MKFFNDKTTAGKTGKEIVFMAISILVPAILSAIVAHPEVFSIKTVAFCRVLLTFATNLLNSNVANL